MNETRVTAYRYTYHPNGLIATLTTDGPLPNDDEVSTYAATGDLLSVSNSLGHTVSWSGHNARGQPGRMTGMNSETIDYLYNEQGRLTSHTTRRDHFARTAKFVYAASGLLDRTAESRKAGHPGKLDTGKLDTHQSGCRKAAESLRL